MTPLLTLEHEYAQTLPQLSVRWQAPPRRDPQLVVLNTGLARDLGLDEDWLRSPDGVAALTGRLPGDGDTYAHAYAGHQFGGYSPVLGDGRAVLLGELVDPAGHRRDLHLKGAGRTPFARRGDGNAVLGPMLREYVVSEAMHALGVPTTRSLSVVTTGETVLREGPQPGAVLARVAASHLRVGTFQYVAAAGDRDLLRTLADYALRRHHPEAARAANPYLDLYDRVGAAQAALVARWMLLGFVHGVMNTDNMTISGETIDYGPCAFMETFDPATVFSSIDHDGRYAWGNQPAAAHWNLARLGEALVPILDPDQDVALDQATQTLNRFPVRYQEAWTRGMAAKLGLAADHPETTALIEEILVLLRAGQVDYTGFFRRLAEGSAAALFPDQAAFTGWLSRRQGALAGPEEEVAAAMNQVNPVYIPRNHVLDEALTAATLGDLTPVTRLIEVIRDPFRPRPGLEEYGQPGTGRYVTYCGT